MTINLPGISARSLNTDEELATLLCDHFYTLETAATWDDHDLFISKTSGGIDVCLKNEAVFHSRESIEAWFRENPVMISYELEEPQEYYMDCCPFLSDQGANILWADTGKISKLLGWHPNVTLEEGVAHILEHIDYWREAPVWTPESIEVATEDWFKYLGKH